MKTLLVIATLSLAMFAQGKPTSAGAKEPEPKVSVENTSKIQGLVIHQQAIELQMRALQGQYKDLVDAANKTNGELEKAKLDALKGAGLDEKKYVIAVAGDGTVTAVPKPDTAPTTPSTEKK
jgi:hypothetical protein